MKKEQCKELWATGAANSVRTLLSRVIDRVRRIKGPNAVAAYSEQRIRIIWNETWLTIDCSSGEFNIHAPTGLLAEEATHWNESLESFHSTIIEPLKDQIGGVATGIGFKENT